MAIQTNYGKAFEYAVSKAFYEKIHSNGMQVANTENSKAYITAKDKFNSLGFVLQDTMAKAAEAGVDTILKFEPNLSYGQEKIEISIQDDGKGIEGDVSDVVLKKHDIDWQVGVSCKHNHTALKHSRLSDTIDFGQSWLGYPCSDEYWEIVKKQFGSYRKMIAGLPKAERPQWKEIAPTEFEKSKVVYEPILIAFKNELLKLHKDNPDVPKKLIQYLIGRKDFYKVIAVDKERKTNIQAFNTHDTLSIPYGKIRARHKATNLSNKMPTKIYNISLNDSKTTLIVVMDNGWTLSMRLHNASSKIEPSLKFDIQLIGVPQSLSVFSSFWN